MITNAKYRNHVSYLGPETSRVPGELADECLDDDVAGDATEVRRMIELSGMIGVECGLLECA